MLPSFCKALHRASQENIHSLLSHANDGGWVITNLDYRYRRQLLSNVVHITSGTSTMVPMVKFSDGANFKITIENCWLHWRQYLSGIQGANGDNQPLPLYTILDHGLSNEFLDVI